MYDKAKDTNLTIWVGRQSIPKIIYSGDSYTKTLFIILFYACLPGTQAG